MDHPRPSTFAPFLSAGKSMSEEEYQEWYAQEAWDPTRYPGLTVEHDLTPASWLDPLLLHESFKVEMSAPRGFESYARIFFPFHRTGIDENGEWYEEWIRWAEMADKHGKVVHPLMEQETIALGRDAGLQCSENMVGQQVEAILPVLGRHTTSPEGWFLLWEGFGNLNHDVLSESVPVVMHPMRNFFLLHGPLDAYQHFADDPNFFWPDDRSWCLSSDTDFHWSYLAGGKACVEEILATSVMDAVETAPENPGRQWIDTINDPDGEIPRD